MPPLTPLLPLLPFIPWCWLIWKAKHFCLFKKRKKKGAGGSAGGITHVLGLISRSLYPPEKLLDTACAAQGKAGSRFAGIYFAWSPHCCLNRGSPLKCLWPLEQRSRGLIRFLCRIGRTTSAAQWRPIYWLHVGQRAVVRKTFVLIWYIINNQCQ